MKDQSVCPARLHFKKLARAGEIETDVSLAAIFGSAIHHGIELRLKNETNPFTAANEYLQDELESKNYNLFESKEYQDKYVILNQCLENFENDFYPSLREALTDPEHQVELKLETPFRKGVLVGKVDVALPGIFADWKSGRILSDSEIATNPQAGFYWYLAQKTGLEPPKEFVYVYLQGKNLAKKVSKTGKMIADRENKMMKYSFSVFPTEDSINRLLNNFIVPLAKAYEDGVVYKNPSQYNCSGCSYRTACWQYDLPKIDD